MPQRKQNFYAIKIGLNLFLCLSVFIISCSQTQPGICIKDGRQYCITSDRIHVITWDACYRRGVNCMEGRCWDYAIEEFKEAIDLRYEDQRQARAYGMHFREEYFPHRELGICYFRLGNIRGSLQELELSMNQTPSARAKYYLNQVRRSYLLETGLDVSPPAIHLELSEDEYLTNQTPLQLKGTVRDEQYVAAISINQKPLFIELAEPAIPFSTPVDLEEGWNTIQVTARDLVDREVHQSIRVYLDQEGPIVMINPILPDQAAGPDQVVVTAVVYDRSGIASFKLYQKEVPRVGLDHLCLIEQTISAAPDVETIPFWTQDRAGNISQGQISLFPQQRRPNLAMRLACRDLELITLAGPGLPARATEGNDISFDITHPLSENLTTYYDEIFMEGRIETRKGIRRIELNGKQLFNLSKIQRVVENNMEDFFQMLLEQNKDPVKYVQLLQEVVQNYNLYYLNQRITLMDEFTDLTLLVEDTLGNQGAKHYYIRKIPREKVFQSEQRMILALLPIDVLTSEGHDLQRYIYNKLIESFIDHGRFNLVEREKLPWVLIEKTIRANGKIYQNDAAQKIGEMAAAEGVICGYLQKREDGTEILARFVEVETGLIRLFHDVFTPSEDADSLNIITSGLAMKFRDSFPICTGAIVAKKGKTIRVDFGSEKGVFPGMVYNIFKDEQELIGKANIKEVAEGFSEAEIPKREKAHLISIGYRVRTR